MGSSLKNFELELRRFIQACVQAKRTQSIHGELEDAQFNELALALYHLQFEKNSVYRNYAEAFLKGNTVKNWREIPAIPPNAFKIADIRCFPAEQTVATFHTSGTTGEKYGRHHFYNLQPYEESILAGWDYFELPNGLPQISLIPNAAEMPHSSLSHMIHVLKQRSFANSTQDCVVSPTNGIDLPLFEKLVNQYIDKNQPILLLGTALSFLNLFELLDSKNIRFQIPSKSQAMETGGYKGSGRTLAKEELYSLFESRLGLKPSSIINEYGMTELSSPLYSRGLNSFHYGPPWVKPLVINPENNLEVKEGDKGVVRLIDLANIGSVLAIQTQDLAIKRPHGAIELIGRDPNAIPRGCSRAADELLQEHAPNIS